MNFTAEPVAAVALAVSRGEQAAAAAASDRGGRGEDKRSCAGALREGPLRETLLPRRII